MKAEFPAVFELGFAEKLQLVEDLWDDLAATPEQIPIPDWQKEELRKRIAAHQQNPNDVIAWDQARQQILNRDPSPRG